MSKKTIFVTGGLGFIGSHTVVELYNKEFLEKAGIKDDIEVVIADNLSYCKEKVKDIIEKLTGKQVTFYKVDLLDRTQTEEIFKKHNFYAIIHFAGKKSVAESTVKPLLYYQNNLTMTTNLIEFCLKYNVHNFIFSSSFTVYGVRNDVCRETDTNLNPISPYGRTKYFIELMLKDVAAAHKDFKVVLLRYANPVSAHPSGLLGEDPNGKPENLFPIIGNYIRGIIKKLYINGNDYETPDGTCIRDYIHIVDLAQAHCLLLKCFQEENAKLFKDNCNIYNVGTNKGYSVLEVFNQYMESYGQKFDFEYGPRRAGDYAAAYPCCDKIMNDLGWKPSKTLKEMCDDALNFLKKNPNGIE